jgi:hypothetical protein
MSYQLTKAVPGRPAPSALGRPLGNGQSPSGDDGPTYDELYEQARERGLKGRSKMSKTELERALGR